MNKIVKIIGLILVGVVLALGVERFILNEKTKSTIFYGELMQKNKITLVSQINNFAHLSSTYKFKIFGSTKIYCKWDATFNFGIDIPENYEWKVKYKSGAFYFTAPKLQLMDVNLGPVHCETVKKGLFVNYEQLRNKKEIDFQNEGDEEATKMLKSRELQRLAKLSLESYLLNLLKQFNPDLLINSVYVSFEN